MHLTNALTSILVLKYAMNPGEELSMICQPFTGASNSQPGQFEMAQIGAFVQKGWQVLTTLESSLDFI